jgi:hypothetical protein
MPVAGSARRRRRPVDQRICLICMLDKRERPVLSRKCVMPKCRPPMMHQPDYTPGHSFAAGSGIRRKRPCTTPARFAGGWSAPLPLSYHKVRDRSGWMLGWGGGGHLATRFFINRYWVRST